MQIRENYHTEELRRGHKEQADQSCFTLSCRGMLSTTGKRGLILLYSAIARNRVPKTRNIFLKEAASEAT